MDGVDDLGVVDALEVDGGDAEVAVAELALNDDERHAFARQLNGVRVAELVRREATANSAATAVRRRSVRAAALNRRATASAPSGRRRDGCGFPLPSCGVKH